MKKENKNNSPLAKKIIESFSTGSDIKYNYKQIAAKIGVFDKVGREQVKKIIDDFVESKILKVAGRGKYRINSKYLSHEFTGKNYIFGKLQVKFSGKAHVVQDEIGRAHV